MRLLHISDVLLGNRNYRREVRDANGGSDLLDLDRRAAFERAVGCAIHQGVDVLLVAGGLLDGHARLSDYRPWLDERLQQLHMADVTPVIYDPENQVDVEARLDAVVVQDDHVADAAGACFAPLHMAADRAERNPDQPVIALAHGRIDGVGGTATHERTIDDRLAAQLQQRVAYAALGGMLQAQPLSSNAWFSGSACSVFAYHPGDPGGLVVQVGPRTRQALDITHVQWDCRRRISITVDGGGMGVDVLAAVLHERLDAVCWAVDGHDPLDHDHPLAELYGAPSCANGVGWWSRPVVNLNVFGTPHTFDAVTSAHPLLGQMLEGGEHLLALVTWEQRGGRKEQHRLVPRRARAAA